MKVIILDFGDGKVKIINHIEQGLQIEEVERILIEDYRFKLSQIEFIIAPELEIETLD